MTFKQHTPSIRFFFLPRHLAGTRNPGFSLAAVFFLGHFLPFGIVDDFKDCAISSVGQVYAIDGTTPLTLAKKEIGDSALLKFISCCEAAGPADFGYYVDADAPISSTTRLVSEPIPERTFVPSIGVCFHESAHAVHLHSKGYRITRAQVGRRNFVERAPGEGARMTSLEQIEAALSGDIGTRYAMFRSISRMGDDEIDTAIARVATGKHGSCDHCLAGVFTRHIAQFSDNPADPSVLRAIWRLAEANVIEMLTSRPAYLAIKRLGVELQDAKEMIGEAAHHILEPYIAFGSQPTTTD